FSAFAEDGPWHFKAGESFVKFSVAIEGSPVDGEFTKFSANILFDKENLDQAKVDITIDSNHIEAAYSDVATNLKKKDWFDVENFPQARFVSQSFKHLGGNDYLVTGELTLRNVTRVETLYFTLIEYDATMAQMNGKMTINRLDYGVGQGGWRDLSTVGGKVFLNVSVAVYR
ncbi:MAG: YceI family protein, partial [Emcibacter sp.]|nr:YceI family protein [Emcibacter sp.]